MRTKSLRRELEHLIKDLETARTKTPPISEDSDEEVSGAKEPTDEAQNHLEALRELASYLTEKANEAEEVVADHPLIGVAAAFTLGLAIGRLTSR